MKIIPQDGIRKQLPRNMRGLFDDLSAQWSDALNQLYNASNDLDQAESALYAQWDFAAQDYDLATEWRAQFDKINAAKSTVDAAKNFYSTASGAWTSAADAVGSWGLNGVKKSMQIGILQFAVPVTIAGVLALVAKITAIVAAVYAFLGTLDTIREMYATNVRQNLIQSYLANGDSPEQASERADGDIKRAAAEANNFSFTSKITEIIKWGGIALLAISIVPKFLDRVK